jgi:thiol-disulfide isomerase/thioredoxin
MSHSIVYIGATWCKPCKTIKPAVETLAKRYGVPVVIKDLDKDLTDAEKEEILKVPTIRVLLGEHRIAEFTVDQVKSLEDWLPRNISLESSEF